jgi:uncharacterized membrane protein YhhN
MRNLILTLLYFILTILFILFRESAIAIFLKAYIMPVLALFFLVNISAVPRGRNLLLLCALIFSCAGDIFLELPADLFVPGLICFLLAHVMYIAVFFTTPGEVSVFVKKPWLILPVIAYGGLLIFLMNEKLGEMRLPVYVYTAVILTMVTGAVGRYGKVTVRNWVIVLSGAVLFLLSDSGIAINRFLSPFSGSHFLIMSTYALGQYLIVSGFIDGKA